MKLWKWWYLLIMNKKQKKLMIYSALQKMSYLTNEKEKIWHQMNKLDRKTKNFELLLKKCDWNYFIDELNDKDIKELKNKLQHILKKLSTKSAKLFNEIVNYDAEIEHFIGEYRND